MKNFEMHCPIDGTSALQAKFETGNVIAFPGLPASCASRNIADTRTVSVNSPGVSRALDSEMIQSLWRGSAHGCSFGRVKPWQAAFIGTLFSIISFASMLLTL